MSPLATVAALLAVSEVSVPLSKRAGLGSVLGYLLAGVALGPFGVRLVEDPESLLHLAEVGVVLLLFVIGLELQPSRLWALRRHVFGLGGLQVAGVGAVLAGIGMGFGLKPVTALVLGWTLALSSTALVLPTLAERKELSTRTGREAFAILLFQDLSVIVLLAVLPLLGIAGLKAGARPGIGLAVLAAVLLTGRPALHWLFVWVSRFGSREMFTAAALLAAIGLALLMQAAGLSMSLGAFVAGVLLADSEFRHELEASIAPFQALLLGLFFIAVGMSMDLALIVHQPTAVFGLALGLMLVKALVFYLLRRFLPHGRSNARPVSLALAQGGEFAFVVFSLLEQTTMVRARLLDELTLAVALSMALTPLLFLINDRLARAEPPEPQRPFDEVPDESVPVVIAGFGRVGQVVGRLLLARGTPFTAIDIDPGQVDTVRRYGMKVYYGDASRLELLHSAGLAGARVLVLAIDDVETSLRTAELVRRHFAHVKVVARARNRFHAYRLLDLGVDQPHRETLLSSVGMGKHLLYELGLEADDVSRLIARFIEHDQSLLLRQHAVYHDESRLMQSSQEARDELVSVLEQDREAARRAAAARG